MIITTQVEWDALPEQFEEPTEIEIRSPANVWIKVLRTPGQSTVWADGQNAIHVESVNSHIFAKDYTTVWNPVGAEVQAEGNAQIIVPQIVPGAEGWLGRHGVDVSETVILYKRVSAEFKTQEGKDWETMWTPGTTLEHAAWNPTSSECGAGKYYACAEPFFCDQFRETAGDKYVAVEIAMEDLASWDNHPTYPHKIGFRRGVVLYECDVNKAPVS